MAVIFAEATVPLPSGPLQLVCDFKALAAVERHVPIPVLMKDFAEQRVSMTGMAALLWGLARARHPALTEDDALQIVLDHGSLLSGPISDVMTAAFADRLKGAPAAGADADPPKRTSGTG